MPKFRKKLIEIEAMQYQGSTESAVQIINWMGASGGAAEIVNDFSSDETTLIIPTLEGNMTAQEKDWVIKGVKGEFYPCKPDIFEATYDKV